MCKAVSELKMNTAFNSSNNQTYFTFSVFAQYLCKKTNPFIHHNYHKSSLYTFANCVKRTHRQLALLLTRNIALGTYRQAPRGADTQHVMVAMDTATVTLVTEVVIWTRGALEAVTTNWFLAAVALDIRVHHICRI